MTDQVRFPFWVLEDNDEDFALLEFACLRAGLNVDISRFSRSEQFLQHAEDPQVAPPTIMYLDLRMPGIGGAEALARIEAIPRYKRTPKLVFSTSANPDEIRQCYDNHANAYHVKVVDTEDMLELMEQTFSYWFEKVELFTHVRAGNSSKDFE